MKNSINQFYTEKVNTYSLLLNQEKKKARQVSMLRLSVFALAISLVFVFTQLNSWFGIGSALGVSVIIFVYLVRKHGLITFKIKLYDAFKTINLNEQKALEGDFSKYDSGDEYLDSEHPFSVDFDVFGEASLFQYLNRTSTHSGKQQLAKKLKNQETKAIAIEERQKFISELAILLDWRQNFQAIGMVYEEKETDKNNILSWVKQEPSFQSKIYSVLLYIIPIATFTLLLVSILGLLPAQLFFIYLFIPWGISGLVIKKVNFLHNSVSKTSEMLNKYSLLIKEIETLDLSSTYFLSLREKLKSSYTDASSRIKKLSSILSALDNRINPVSWAFFNAIALWDILQAKRLEAWQKQNRDDINNWFFVLAETDALCSLGNYAFNHPDATYPEINDGNLNIKAVGLGHPLILPKDRVNNDFSINSGEFTIITGANMAGKSTYLRTIGVNLILAQTGAPVCAKFFSFTPVSLFSSIRTHDSLLKNESYFYAELKRLKRIIEELKEDKTLFVILDEILKGTNSKDKHSGSEALIKQLLSYNTGGIIATHDVSLGELAKLFPTQIKNLCFEVDIEDNELIFDYKIKPGISQNMNATILMKKRGITI